MNTLLKIFNLHDDKHDLLLFSTQIKAVSKTFSKVLFSFLFIVFFLASCSGEDSFIVNERDITLDPVNISCPSEDDLVPMTIAAGEEDLTITDELSGVTTTGGNLGVSSIDYFPGAVTKSQSENRVIVEVMATARNDAGARASCNFAVEVLQDEPILTCPDWLINVRFPVTSPDTIDPDRISAVTATDNSGIPPTISYDITPGRDVFTGAFGDVHVTATDNDGNTSFCEIIVSGTRDVYSETFKDTTFTNCNVDGSTVIPIAFSSEATVRAFSDAVTGITATDATEGMTTNTYFPARLATDAVGMIPITVTARDSEGGVAQFASAEDPADPPADPPAENLGDPAICEFMVNVIPAFTNCPEPNDITLTGRTASWTIPTPASRTIQTPEDPDSIETLDRDSGTPPTPTFSVLLGLVDYESNVTIETNGNRLAITFPQNAVFNIPYTITYAGISDSFGNEATCIFDVTIPLDTTDTSPPEFTSCTSGSASATVNYPRGLTNFVFNASTPGLGATDTETDIASISYNPPMAEVGTTPTIMATATNNAVPPLTSTCSFTVTFSETGVMGSEMFVRSMPNDNNPGTATNPYLIVTEDDFSNFASLVNSGNTTYRNAHYRLAQTIEFDRGDTGTGDAVTADTSNFTPIGTGNNHFSGTFNGDSYTISGLRYHRSNANNVGLFGIIGSSNASISNLILTNVNITGRTNVGGLVGRVNGSLLINISVSGEISGNNHIGGLVGQVDTNGSGNRDNRKARIFNVFSSGTITGGSIVGGVIGGMTETILRNAGSSADVNETTENLGGGGVIGAVTTDTARNSFITNIIAWGRVSSVDESLRTSGLIGNFVLGSMPSVVHESMPTYVINSYWDTTTTTQSVAYPRFFVANRDNILPQNVQGLSTSGIQVAGGEGSIYENWNNIPAADLDADDNNIIDVTWVFQDGAYPELIFPGRLNR